MNRKGLIQKLENLNISFSVKDSSKRLQSKLDKIETVAIKAFTLLDNGTLQTGGIGGSKKTLFEVGKTYTLDNKKPLELCSNGFHFYTTRDACFGYGLFDSNTVFHRIIAYGEVISDTEKCVARKLKVCERVALKLDDKSNSGNSNSGYRNSGNYNSGSYNSGSYNSGYRNSGYYNSGNYNSGYYNSGNTNSGYYNSGNTNSGNYNSGNRNSGNRNSGNYNSGNRNSGNYNSGYYNSGNRNSGKYNSGDCNSGSYNSGSYNSGHKNSGDCNSGFYNSGHNNSGHNNSGNGYRNHFCEETKFFLFDIEVHKEVIDKVSYINMAWFSLKGKTYKEAWKECPESVLEEFSRIAEFQTKEAKEKFKRITGLSI